MTLKKKILIGYGIAFILMGGVIAWAVANLVSLGQASDAILHENYRSILAAETMVNALERQDSGILLLLIGDRTKGIAQFRENEARFIQWLARAKDNITIAGEAELVQAIETDYTAYRQLFSELTEIPGTHRPEDTSLQTYQDAVYPRFAKVYATCMQLRKLNESTMYAASMRAGQIAKRAIWSTVLVAASALSLALTFSLLLAERIVRPLRRFMAASRQISSGNYALQVPIETRDELGRLAGEFNQMAIQLERYHAMNIEQIIAEKNKGAAILASIEDGLVVFDTNLRVIEINPAARRMLHLEFAEGATLQDSDILPVPHVCDLIRTTVATGMQPNVPEEKRTLTLPEDSHSHHYLFYITTIRGKEQSLSGIVLLLRDVTRLKEVEQLKSDFVMAASHELRTPLTSLGMSIDLLLEHATEGFDTSDWALLQAAHEEVHRMKALVNDLLDLSRIEAGRIDLEFVSVPVQALLDHVQAMFKGQTDKKQVELTMALSDDLPNMRGDVNKLTWVLTNLISNALRYVSEGGHIDIMAKKVGEHVHLSVRDDGPGIPFEYHSKIFQKFVQVKGQEAGGTGLGLAICKEIVRAHGGTIWVESTPGQGSTFTFTVPVAR